jgi:HSP20 family protein
LKRACGGLLNLLETRRKPKEVPTMLVLDFHGRGALRSFLPPADVTVTDDQVTIVMDVPGFKPSELDVELLGDRLTVRGERAFPYAGDGGRRWQRLERGFGTFERVLNVPEGLDPEAIVASLNDGVLTLVIPMPETRKPRKISIAAADGAREIEASAAESGSEHDREPAGATA